VPELPEVETVRAGLQRLLGRATIARVVLNRRDLRTPFPRDLASALAGRRVRRVRRRAKYLLIDTDGPGLLCHLGMTGVWRLAPEADRRTHDHAELHLADGRRVVFNDPRRFGLLDLLREGDRHPALDGLGPEPLGDGFDAAWLAERFATRRRGAVKAVIMDQAVVVGVGNIYAAESLFRSGIRPGLPAGRVSRPRIDRLVAEIRAVLAEAIKAGGSSIDDFRHVNGLSGLFQNDFRVYGRKGEPCRVCGTAIRAAMIGGRSSFWCPTCQR
jgi:formamidopyrimidine-DNA glycosylase